MQPFIFQDSLSILLLLFLEGVSCSLAKFGLAVAYHWSKCVDLLLHLPFLFLFPVTSGFLHMNKQFSMHLSAHKPSHVSECRLGIAKNIGKELLNNHDLQSHSSPTFSFVLFRLLILGFNSYSHLCLHILMMKTIILGAILSLAAFAVAITEDDATAAFNTLQQWYNESIGLWIPSTGWWNSANCSYNSRQRLVLNMNCSSDTYAGLTVIADLAQIDDTVKEQAASIWPNTFAKAQEYNLEMQKVVGSGYLPHCYYGHHWPHFPPGHHRPRPHRTNGFLNE